MMKYKFLPSLLILLVILTEISSYFFYEDTNYVAKINGEMITSEQFDHAYNTELIRQQYLLGKNYTSMSKNIDFNNQVHYLVLLQLIYTKLIEQYLNKNKLVIKNSQFKENIIRKANFSDQEKLSTTKYNNILSSMGITSDQYIKTLYNQIVTKYFIKIINDTDFLLKNEINYLLALIKQQRVIRTLIIKTNMLLNKQRINKREIEYYYYNNRYKFMSPEKIKVNYIKLDLNYIRNYQIQSWYNQHILKYTKPARLHLNVIKVNNMHSAMNILKKLKRGYNFNNIASQESIDSITAQKRGDIGWFNQDNMPKEFRNSFLSKRGQLCIVKALNGYWIIRLVNFQPPIIKPLSLVREKIEHDINQCGISNSQIYRKLQNFISKFTKKDTSSLKKISRVMGVTLKKTGWFSYFKIPKEINFKSIRDIIFNYFNKVNKINDKLYIVSTNKGYFIIEITNYQPKFIRSISSVYDQITQILRYNKANQEGIIKANEILEKLESKNSQFIDKLKFSIPIMVNRSDQSEIARYAFKLSKPINGHATYGVFKNSKNDIVILELEKVKINNLSDIQKKIFFKKIISINTQITIQTLLNSLRNSARISYGSSIYYS